jgi:hypothetical protein
MTTIFRELFSYRVLIQTLVLRDLKGRYRGSALGLLWTLLNPLLYMGIYALVFSVYMRISMERYATFLLFGPLGNFQANFPPGPQRPDPGHEFTGVCAISPDAPQPRELVPKDIQQMFGAIAVLSTGRRDHHGQEQTSRIDDDVPLAPFDLFGGIVPTHPPFSVVFTD